MPRCRNAVWCIDDLCYGTDRTLCGLWFPDDIDESGEWAEDDEWSDED